MSERQEALQLVTVAIPPLQQIDRLYDQALQLEQRNTAVSTGAKFNASRKGTLLGLVSGFAIWFILDILSRTPATLPGIPEWQQPFLS